MKLTIVILCLLLAVSFVAGDRGKWRKTPYTCKIKTDQGKYCFGKLYKDSGNAWSGADSNGDIVYFNLCGDLSNEAEASSTPGCDPTAASCVLTADGTYINAGRPDDDSLAVSIEDNTTVQFNYSNGDACPSGFGTYQTIIQLTCADDQDLLITSVNYNATTCQVLVQGVSEYACPRQGHWGGRNEGHGAPFFVFLLPILCCCCACLCIARCCRRRRCQRQQQTQANYTVVPQEEPAQTQQPVAVPQPYIIPTQFQSQFQPQYYQPNPYYVYVPQYGNPAVPAPQPPVTTPVAPIIPLEDNSIEMRETQLDSDEKVARELQAKFDNE